MYSNDPYGLIAPAMLAELHKSLMNMRKKPGSSERAEPRLSKARLLLHWIVNALARRKDAPAAVKAMWWSQ